MFQRLMKKNSLLPNGKKLVSDCWCPSKKKGEFFVGFLIPFGSFVPCQSLAHSGLFFHAFSRFLMSPQMHTYLSVQKASSSPFFEIQAVVLSLASLNEERVETWVLSVDRICKRASALLGGAYWSQQHRRCVRETRWKYGSVEGQDDRRTMMIISVYYHANCYIRLWKPCLVGIYNIGSGPSN